jgi:hypothetical protein
LVTQAAKERFSGVLDALTMDNMSDIGVTVEVRKRFPKPKSLNFVIH